MVSRKELLVWNSICGLKPADKVVLTHGYPGYFGTVINTDGKRVRVYIWDLKMAVFGDYSAVRPIAIRIWNKMWGVKRNATKKVKYSLE